MSTAITALPLTGYLISDLVTIPAIDRAADLFEVEDVSASTSNKVTINTMLGLTGNPVGHTDSQTLSNKTLGITNTITVLDDNFTVQDGADNTKQAKFQLSSITTGTIRTYTFPNATGTLADTASTQTFTNKTLTSAVLTTPTINNPTLNTDTVNQFTGGNGVTVSGLNVKSGALNTANSVPTAAYQDGSIAPEHLVTGAGTGWALSSWSPTWTNLTVGNGTVTAGYLQIGKMVYLRIMLVFGSTSAISGNVIFSLPVNAVTSMTQNDGAIIGNAKYVNSGVAAYLGAVGIVQATQTGLLVVGKTDGTYNTVAALSSIVPFTWAAGSVIQATAHYEAA